MEAGHLGTIGWGGWTSYFSAAFGWHSFGVVLFAMLYSNGFGRLLNQSLFVIGLAPFC